MRIVAVHPGVVYFPDRDWTRAAWDVFSDLPTDNRRTLGLYDQPRCRFKQLWEEVLRAMHPQLKLRYVGSEDNMHSYENRPPPELP